MVVSWYWNWVKDVEVGELQLRVFENKKKEQLQMALETRIPWEFGSAALSRKNATP